MRSNKVAPITLSTGGGILADPLQKGRRHFDAEADHAPEEARPSSLERLVISAVETLRSVRHSQLARGNHHMCDCHVLDM